MSNRASTFFVQSTYGGAGNFEVVTDSPNDGHRGLVHRWRDNDNPAFPWIYAGHFYRGRYVIRRPSVIQDRATGSGRLQVVAIATGADGRTALRHFVRANNPTWAWGASPEELPGSAGLDFSSNPALIESSLRPVRRLEVFAAVRSGGIARWWRTDAGWEHGGTVLTELGAVDAITVVESTFGRLEMLIRRGPRLEHLSRPATAPDTAWSAPAAILENAAGVPGFVHGRHGPNGNFEVVTADTSGGLTGTWADTSDRDNPRWMGGYTISGPVGGAAGDLDAVGLVQSTFGTPGAGNLEVLLRRAGRTYFCWRIDTPPWTWSPVFPIANDPPDESAALRRTDTLERRLAGCDDLRAAMAWETATGDRLVYDAWSRAQKDRLNDLFARLLDDRDLALPCPDPNRNMSLRPRPSGITAMFLTAAEAFEIYAAHVAHVFYLEATGRVGWSILDLPSAELQELLSSDRYHTRILDTPLATAPEPYYPAHIRPNRDYQLPYRVQVSGRPLGLLCDPRIGWRFLRGTNSSTREDLLGPDEETTLANISWWASKNLAHGGEPGVDDTRAYYATHTYLQDRLRAEHRDWGSGSFTGVWAPQGCQNASTLLHDLARSVNIPLLAVTVLQGTGFAHQGLLFRWQRPDVRHLQHTDDVYIALRMAPFFSLRPDGTAASAAEARRHFFEVQWSRPEALTAAGFRLSDNYDPIRRPSEDTPHANPDGGGWVMGTDIHSFALEKRYQLCSWREFVEEYCRGTMSEARLTSLGARLFRPFAEYQARARAAAAAYGGCAGMETSTRAWEAESGRHVWVDR
ncbi:MAG TPA: hypothetical protein VEU29_02655 [Actinomycetota bacterium]|nr:hypothetical protein [Actinomycetota bacterium]